MVIDVNAVLFAMLAGLGVKVWPQQKPQDEPDPCVVYSTTAGTPSPGSAPLMDVLIDTTCYGTSQQEAGVLAGQVRGLLEDKAGLNPAVRVGPFVLAGEEQGYDEQLDIWGVTLRWAAVAIRRS